MRLLQKEQFYGAKLTYVVLGNAEKCSVTLRSKKLLWPEGLAAACVVLTEQIFADVTAVLCLLWFLAVQA